VPVAWVLRVRNCEQSEAMSVVPAIEIATALTALAMTMPQNGDSRAQVPASTVLTNSKTKTQHAKLVW
jgi:hypothetical protein